MFSTALTGSAFIVLWDSNVHHGRNTNRKECIRTWAPMGIAHVCTYTVRPPVRVRGGTTLEVVPQQPRTGGRAA